MSEPTADELEFVAAVLNKADAELVRDLAQLEGVDLDELHAFLDVPDPTDDMEHD